MSNWRTVPQEVAQLIKEGSAMFARLRAAAKALPRSSHVGVWFNPRTQQVYFSLGEDATDDHHSDWVDGLKVRGVKHVQIGKSKTPPDKAKGPWLHVKQAALSDIFSTLSHAGGWRDNAATNMVGGASPVTAMLASGALGAGAGYGTGYLAEQLLPNRFFDKGKLRRTLGMAGGLAGVAPGFWMGADNMRHGRSMTDTFGAHPEGYEHPVKPDHITEEEWKAQKPIEDHVAVSASIPPYAPWRSSVDLHDEQRAKDRDFTNLHLPDRRKISQDLRLLRSINDAIDILADPDDFTRYEMNKLAEGFDAGADYVKAIEKDRFNRSLWDDPFTPEPIKGMTSGVLEGASQIAGGVNAVSPADIARLGVGMGTGWASGLVVGKALGALAGLNSDTQSTLQRAGVWGGLVSNMVPMLFGSRPAQSSNEFYR